MVEQDSLKVKVVGSIPTGPTMDEQTCSYCKQPATYTDSVPDKNSPGINLNECGYKIVFLCAVHGLERMQVATSRIKPLVLPVQHSQLLKVGEAAVQCPACRRGVLKLTRDAGSFVIQPQDICTLCGQRVEYMDVAELRSKDWAGIGLDTSEMVIVV